MTKILFFGDTHLDIERPFQINRQRKSEFQDIFKQIIDYAVSNKVNLICHLGDLFDNFRPSPTEVGLVIQQLMRLEEHNISFYLIRGNHEGSADIEDLFRGWAGDYVKIPSFSKLQLIDPRFDESRKIETVGYRDFNEHIRIYGIGYYRHDIKNIIKKYIPLNSLDSSKINILLLHGLVEKVNDSYPFTRSEVILPLDEITALSFDLVALGHAHSKVEPVTKSDTTFVAPGSPVDWKFKHLGSHGFYVTEIDETNKNFSFQWEEIDTQYVMKLLTIDSKGAKKHRSWFEDQIREELKTLLSSTDKKIILEVHLKGTYTDDSPRIQVNAIRTLIEEIMKDRLLFLGQVVVKGLQYETKKEINIEDLREIKMDEEQIIEILKKTVDDELAQIVLELYKKTDEAYSDPLKLTSKKNELKSGTKEELERIAEDKIFTYYKSKVTDKELEKIEIVPSSVKVSTAKSKKEGKAKKAEEGRQVEKGEKVKKVRKPKKQVDLMQALQDSLAKNQSGGK